MPVFVSTKTHPRVFRVQIMGLAPVPPLVRWPFHIYTHSKCEKIGVMATEPLPGSTFSEPIKVQSTNRRSAVPFQFQNALSGL